MAKESDLAKRVKRLCFWAVQIAALYGQNIKTGPEVSQQVPAFSAPDQHGRTQTLKLIAGPRGAMLVFFRSADW